MASDDESESARADGLTLAEVRKRLAGRWDCRAITAGFVGIPKDPDPPLRADPSRVAGQHPALRAGVTGETSGEKHLPGHPLSITFCK